MNWPSAAASPGLGLGAVRTSGGGPTGWDRATPGGVRSLPPSDRLESAGRLGACWERLLELPEPGLGLLDLTAQVVVDVVAQAVTDEDVDERRSEDDRQRDRGGREQRQPPAQGHFSRRA